MSGWTLIKDGRCVVLVDPEGGRHGPLDDFNAVLDVLGPLTPATELASEAVSHALEAPVPSPGAPRPHAYICSPYAARDGESIAEHVLWARGLCRLAWDDGYWPVAPHLYAPQWLRDEGTERAYCLNWGLSLLPACRAVCVFSDDRPSAGMREELAEADRLSLPCRSVSASEIAAVTAPLLRSSRLHP